MTISGRKFLRQTGDFFHGSRRLLEPLSSYLTAAEALSKIDLDWIQSGGAPQEIAARGYLESMSAAARVLPTETIGFGESLGHAFFWSEGALGLISKREVTVDRILLRANAKSMQEAVDSGLSRTEIENNAEQINMWLKD